jgi:hypothetical protein
MKMTTSNLIGNEKQKDEDLLAIARKNATINDVLEGREIRKEIRKENYVLKLKPCDNALKIIKGLEKVVKQSDEVLFSSTYSQHQDYYTNDNALIAIAYSILGEKKKSQSIMDALSNRKDDNGLFLDTLASAFRNPISTCLMGLAYAITLPEEMSNDAMKFLLLQNYLKTVENRIGFVTDAKGEPTKLIRHETISNDIYTGDNASYALLESAYIRYDKYSMYSIRNDKEIMNIIKELNETSVFDKESEFYYESNKDSDFKNIGNSALMALAYLHMPDSFDMTGNAAHLFGVIIKNIVPYEKTDLIRSDISGHSRLFFTYENAALALLYMAIEANYQIWL